MILFYVTGHGYGHARRMAQVIAALRARDPGIPIRVRSGAPARLFEPLAAAHVAHSQIDPGPVEADALTIDRAASLRHLLQFMDRREETIAAELAAVRAIAPELIVADIPFLAGDVAAIAGVPCVGISNFTWDWIFDELFGGDSHYRAVAPVIRAGYAKLHALLELPFGITCPSIERKIRMPLIAAHSDCTRADVSSRIGIAPADSRPRVLIGMRGGMEAQTLGNAAANAPRFLFLYPGDPPPDPPANLLPVRLGSELKFSDLLRGSDIVVSKLGYGVLSECISANVRLLWPPRQGFAEDAVTSAQAPRYLRMLPIPRSAFEAGNWRDGLNALMEVPEPLERLGVDGAARCADYLVSLLQGRNEWARQDSNL